MENRTILFLSDVFGGFGGAERNIFQIATSLNNNGYRSIICSLHGGVDLDNLINHKNKYFDGLKTSGLQIINLNIRRAYSYSGILKLLRLGLFIKKENVELIVSYHEVSDVVGIFLSLLIGIPAISSRRDMGFKLKKRHIKLYKLINRFFERIITVSDAVKNIIAEREGVHPFKMTTVYNGTDLDYFAQRVDVSEVKERMRLPEDKPIIGVLAGIKKIKGLNFLIEAASSIIKEFPDVQFMIVGECVCPEEMVLKSNLINLAIMLGISTNVHFFDKSKKVNEVLRVMDINVLPSLSEGFSNTVIEAMAAGKPVVSTNIGGNPEAVEHRKTGLLVPPSDSKALAEAVLTLLRDREYATRMGEAGRKRAEEFFSLEAMVGNAKGVFEAAIQSRMHENRLFRMHSMLKAVKLALSNMVYKTGLVHSYCFLSSKTNSDKGITILCYHKVEDSEDILDMSVSLRNFERQLVTLKKFYNIIPLSDAIDLIENNGSIPCNAVVVTFDDGYRCLYTNAYPIIKSHGIPATIFLVANVMDNEMELWYDRLCRAIDRSDKKEVFFNGKKVFIGDRCAKGNFKKEAVYALKKLADDRKIESIADLMLQLDNGKGEESKNNNLYLSNDEITEMKLNGVIFGSHTLNHPILTQMPVELAKKEIIDSKRELEEKLGAKIEHFAYPNGYQNEELKKIIRETGYRSALTLDYGTNKKKNSDTFALKRINVTEGMCTNIWGRYSEAMFLFHIMGFNKKLSSPFKSSRVKS